MALTTRIAEVERELRAQKDLVEVGLARLRGLEAELDALRRQPLATTSPVDLPRSDAILTVLRDEGGTLAVAEIIKRLIGLGRTDAPNSVSATLSYLLGRNEVRRVDRGRYIAV